MSVGNSKLIPNYLAASTPQGLRRACLINNLKFGTQFEYFDFQYVNGKWVCWFYQAISINDANKEILKPETK